MVSIRDVHKSFGDVKVLIGVSMDHEGRGDLCNRTIRLRKIDADSLY